MADTARPALARTLAVLTQHDPDRWPDDSFSRVVAAFAGAGWTEKTIDASGWDAGPLSARWTTTDPADAAELLTTRGVLPQGWCGDLRRAWACKACGGTGHWTMENDAGACFVCDGDAYYTEAPNLPDLVAVASLGWPAIQRAEELAREACLALREYGCPTPDRVVWRVGQRLPADAVLWRDRDLVAVRVVASVEALWASGLALDRITPEAVVVVVPPVGGGR